MLTKMQTLRSSVSTSRPAVNSQAPGVLYVNFADLQLGVINTAGSPQDLIAIRFHSDAASYAAGEMVVVDGVIYRALAAVPAGAFDAAQWQAISGDLVTSVNGKIGDVVLTAADLGAADANHNHDALYAPKALVSADLGNISYLGSDGLVYTPGSEQIATSDTPPPGAKVGDLWYNPTNGQLHVYYQDANSTQWVSVSGLGGGSAAGGSSVTTGDTPPASPAPGDLWYCSTDGQLYVYYTDADSSQWVSTTGGAEAYVLPAATDTTLGGVLVGPAFAAHGSALVSVANNTNTKLNYDTALFNAGGAYNTALSRFTPSVAGYYQVNARLLTGAPASANAALSISIFKNGVSYTNCGVISVTGVAGSPLVACVVYLNGSTDYLECYGTQNTGAALTMGSSSANQLFSASFLRGA
jgi:hypothetical protein